MPHKHHAISQTGFQGYTHDDHAHLKIQNISEKPSDQSHYLLSAITEINAGQPIPGYYHGPTVVYIIEGELVITDKSTGKVSKLVAGDVLHIDNGTSSTWSSPNKVKIFGASYVPTNIEAGDYVKK